MEEAPATDEIRAKVIAAAEAVWRVTGPDWFDATLREELRRSAIGVITAVSALSLRVVSPGPESIDTVLAAIAGTEELLRFAAGRSLVSDENAERIIRTLSAVRERASEFHVIEDERRARREEERREREVSAREPFLVPLHGRGQRIIAFIRANGQAQVGDLAKFFGEEVSEKTLQRDLTELVHAGTLRRKGDNRWTTY